MDPRQQRTRARLADAVHAIAAERPIADVTVAELARAAGVTRDTFYRHAASAADLLASVLREELEAGLAAVEARVGRTDRGALVSASELALLEHVSEHVAIYRNAMAPRLVDPVRDMLLTWLEAGLADLLASFPGIVPPAGGLGDAERDRIAVAYAASGTVGAIEAWLAAGAPGGAEAASRAIIAASPEWWLRSR